MGGGGKGSSPKVEKVEIPAAATPAPPPETTAATPTVGGGDEGSIRHKERDAKKKGTSALRIDLNLNNSGNSGVATPGGGGGLSIPKG